MLIKPKKLFTWLAIKLSSKSYWVATGRFDLLAELVALVYKLNWDIKSFSHGGNGPLTSNTFLLKVRMALWFRSSLVSSPLFF